MKRLSAVLTGMVGAVLAVSTLPVLSMTAQAAVDPLGGQPGPVTLAPTMGQDQWQPTPPAGTTVDDFMRHPVLSWGAITSLPVTRYHVEISPNADFTNNQVALPGGGITVATEYDLPQNLPHASYFWRVRGEDAAGHATNWAGTSQGDRTSRWQFTKTWADAPTGLSPATGQSDTSYSFSWSPLPDASAYEIQIADNAQFLPSVTNPAWTQGAKCAGTCTSAPWNNSTTYTAGQTVGYGGYEWTAARTSTGEAPALTPTTYADCTTTNTSYAPYKFESLQGGASLKELPYPIDCDSSNPGLAKALESGGAWYWRVRGLDQTSAGLLSPADPGPVCYESPAPMDCSQWSSTQLANFVAASANFPPTAAVAASSLAVNCPGHVSGSVMPLCYGTPTLSWAPVADANGYWVDVSSDPLFTTGFQSYLVAGNSLTPRVSYYDNQAGRSYYWRVQACGVDWDHVAISCSPADAGQAPQSAFHKASLPLPKDAASGVDGLYVTVDNNETFAGAVRTVRSQQMTFHWDDFLTAERAAGVQPQPEAKEYELEYSTTGNWLDDATTTTVTTDATHWTKQDGFLPDGGYYWRVAPIDGSGNLLSWSDVQTVVKGTVAPTVSVADNGLLNPTGAVTLQFAAPVSGVTSASLGLKVVGGGAIPGHIVWPAPTPTMATFTPDKPLLPGEKVMPWVTSAVVDLAGNPARVTAGSSTVNPTVDSAATGTIRASWSKIAASKASGHSYAKSAGARDQISFAVNGSSVKLIGVRTTDGGYATVYVDGVPRKTVNFHASRTTYGVVLWSALLNEGAHRITIEVKGSHAKGSKGNAVNVDAVKVDGRLIQQTSATQTWSGHRSTDAYKGSYAAEASYLSTWKGSKPTLSMTFMGTAVHVVGCKAPDGGKWAIYVDGKLKATGDAYQGYTACNKMLVHVRGLHYGTHTVTVAALGTHSKKATGTKVAVDAIVAS